MATEMRRLLLLVLVRTGAETMATEFSQLAEGLSVEAKPNEGYLVLPRTKRTLRRPRLSFCALEVCALMGSSNTVRKINTKSGKRKTARRPS